MGEDGQSSISKLQEQQMFLERDVERLEEQAGVMLERIEEMTTRIVRLEGRLDKLLELPFEDGGDEFESLTGD